jgi:hypothetical protein
MLASESFQCNFVASIENMVTCILFKKTLLTYMTRMFIAHQRLVYTITEECRGWT